MSEEAKSNDGYLPPPGTLEDAKEEARKLAPGREHYTINNEFLSDKFDWSEPGFLPLKISDEMAQDLSWEYAQRRRKVDPEFSRDLEDALIHEGYNGN